MTKKNNPILNFNKEWQLHLMLLVPVILLVIYAYLPMFGIVISFMNYKPLSGFFRSTWVGFKNYTTLFSLPEFNIIIRNTIVISLAKIITGIVVPVVFALLLNEMSSLRLKRTIQTVIYMPHFISWVILSKIFLQLLSPNGIVNRFLSLLGSTESIVFLAEKNLFPVILVITNIWKEFGYGTIIYLAALTGIDPTLYEAAAIDGAGRWRQTLHVTLPGLVPMVVLMTVLSLSRLMNAGFDQVFNMYNPLVYVTGDIIDTFVYRIGLGGLQFSLSTAAGVFKSIISCIMIIISYRIAYKTTGYKVF
jgi:putative aldouronate transport system permease protein